MSETVTIAAVNEERDWESPDGKIKNTFYQVVIGKPDGTEEEVDHARQQGRPAPEPGEELEVYFEPGKFRRRMKKAQQGGGFEAKTSSTGTAGSSNKKSDWKPESEYDPERVARIVRQHSQEMAVRTLTAMGSFEKRGTTEHQTWIKEWADFFDKDVTAAGEATKQGVVGSPGPEQATPNPSPGPPVSPPAGPSFTELGQALDTAGLFGAPADQVAAYMAAELKPEQQDNAIRKLIDAADPETQSQALQSLKTLTEKWQSAPLATDEVDDSIPF